MATASETASPMDALDRAIGRLSRAWSHLDWSLTVVMSELMEVQPETGSIVSAALDYRHRRDLTKSLAALKLEGDSVAPLLTAWMASVGGMNTERNRSIHALWMMNPETGRMTRITMLNRGLFDMKLTAVAPGHLLALADKINTLSNDGLALVPRLQVAMRTWREKWPPLTWPPL